MNKKELINLILALWIRKIDVDIPTLDLVNLYPSLLKRLKNYMKYFHNGDWGIITKRDKIINDIMLETGNYCGIVGVYRDKLGDFMIDIQPESDTLFISYFGNNKVKFNNYRFERMFEGIKI